MMIVFCASWRRNKTVFCRAVQLLLLALMIGACQSQPTPQASERQALATQTGKASFYGAAFHGEETASGETFDKNELVAAHPTYPLGSILRVTRLENNRSVEVRVNDRGPSEAHQAEGVIIDLSRAAASELGFISEGRAEVKVEVLAWGKDEKK